MKSTDQNCFGQLKCIVLLTSGPGLPPGVLSNGVEAADVAAVAGNAAPPPIDFRGTLAGGLDGLSLHLDYLSSR